ncbi:MAG: hypothetical protein Q7U04_11365, partial [Bacteriovorax sp.]|nr:hypothetical protein [Bacteriovorax sp.]
MKSMNIFFILLFASFALNNLAIAEEEDSPVAKTAHSYDREKFCETGAKKQIEELNQLTADDVDKIKDLKKKINENEARKKIITDMQILRDDYLSALDAITSEAAKTRETSRVQSNSIDQFKKLLNKTLTLNAITLMLQENKDNKKGPMTIKELCATKNAELLFCKRYGEVGNIKGAFNGGESANINKTLSNFSEAMEHISDKDKTAQDVKKIIDSIPENLKAEGTLELLSSKSPLFLKLISNAQTRDEVTKCLEKSDTLCEKLLTKSDIIKNINEEVQKEIVKVGDNFSKNQGVLKEQIDINISKDLERLTHSFNYPLEVKEQKDVVFFNDKLSKLKAGFVTAGAEASGMKEITESCDLKEKAEDQKNLKSKMANCRLKINALFEKSNLSKDQLDKNTEALKIEMAKLIDNNTRLFKIEKIKQFVIQRYIRGCSEAKTKEATLISNVQQLKCENLSQGPSAGTEQVGSFSLMLDKVLDR